MYLVKPQSIYKPLCKSHLSISSQMKAHKLRTVKIHILSQQAAFFSFYFLLPHLKICPPCHFPNMKTPPFLLTASDFPFPHNPGHSRSESAMQSREAWSAPLWVSAEMRWNEARLLQLRMLLPYQRSQPLPGADPGDWFLYSWATSSVPTLCFLSGLCWQRGCWCWMCRSVETTENPQSAGRASTSPHLQTLLRHSQARWNATSWGVWMLGKKCPLTSAQPVLELGKLCCRWCWAKPACHIIR